MHLTLCSQSLKGVFLILAFTCTIFPQMKLGKLGQIGVAIHFDASKQIIFFLFLKMEMLLVEN